MKNIFTLIIGLFLSVSLIAQDFHSLMSDPTANFYEIKAAAEEYFKDKDQGPETEYSRYKRWEYIVEPRVFPSGNMSLMKLADIYQELQFFKAASPTLKSQPQWIELGVDKYDNIAGHWSPGVGRIDRVAVDPVNSEIIYAGAPSGGILKSTDRGKTWRSMCDNLPTMGVSGIAINPENPQEIYISTGDGDGGYTYTSGVFKSSDGGETWEMTGFEVDLSTRQNSKDLIMNPDHPEILFVSTSIGVYKTVDGGENWYQVINGQFDDLSFKPGDPETVYVTTTTGFYASRDGGETFEKNDVSLSGRVLIGVTPAEPEFVYLVAGLKGTFKSVDSGVTFEKVADLPVDHAHQGYMFALAVSPTDPNELHFGTFNSYRSYDGGATWTMTTDWTWNNNVGYTHCDFHDIVYLGDTIFTCTDGGLSYSTDKGESWTVCFDHANCTQIYNVAVCKSNPELYMWGAQDNGVYHFDGNRWWGWLGADGMDMVYDYNNPGTRYGCVQNGGFYCSSHPIKQPGKGAWVTPVKIHPTNPEILYVGNDKVRKSLDGMRNWSVIGSFGGDSYIIAMEVAESNPDFIFASKGSKIWRTINGGAFWTEVTAGLPSLSITRIAVHPKNERVVAVSFSGYNDGQKVYISYDAGLSWTNYSKNLPNIPTGGLAFDDKWNNALYVGMDVGLYYIDNQRDEWSWYGEGLPNVLVRDIEIHHASGQLFTGTHGRGLWKIPTREPDEDIRYCEASGQNDSETTFITGVKIGEIDRSSEQDDYFIESNQHAVIEQGRYYPLEISLSKTSVADAVAVWIDWNNDQTFDETEKISLSSPDENNVVMGMVSVPAEAVFHMTRMRVRSTQNKESLLVPCGIHPGEVEDYQILVATSPVDYCPVISENRRNEFIKEVEIADLKVISNGYFEYSDYSSYKTANVHRGDTYQVRLTPEIKRDTVTLRWRIYIDYDMNGDFLGVNELALSEASTGPFESTITIPQDAVFGKTRMRIMMQRGDSPEPCVNIEAGEIEDYSLLVKPRITGIDRIQLSGKPTDFQVYPNPGNGDFQLILSQLPDSPLTLDVVNTAGQIVQSRKIAASEADQLSVNLRHLDKGLYFFFIRNERGYTSQQRVILQ